MRGFIAILLAVMLFQADPLSAAQVTTDLQVVASDDGLPAAASGLSYAWTTLSQPAGSTVVFSPSPGMATPRVSLDTAGSYTLRITVGDGHLYSVRDLVITVLPRNPVASFVTRFYRECLQRDPETAGLSTWTADLKTGTRSGGEVARGFILSQEFRSRDLGDEAFVGVLYQAFFGRGADAPGKAAWLAELARGVQREDVLDGFIFAQEFANLCADYGIQPSDPANVRRCQVRQFVRRFYQQCLGREPDEGGINTWCACLLDGTRTGSDVARGFISSPEFTARGISDPEYLEVLYRAFFDRTGDPAGRIGWLARLDAGTSRTQVLTGFVGSPEFSALCQRFGILPSVGSG